MSEHPFHKDDIADRARAVRESIAAKQATRPRTDNQGRLIDPPVTYEYDNYGRLIGPVKANPSDDPAT